MARDSENFGGDSGTDRRVCAHHSGVDAKQTIFNWLLGVLIAAIIASAGTLSSVLGGVREAMSSIQIELASMKSDKAFTNDVHQRLADRLTTLERAQEKRQ